MIFSHNSYRVLGVVSNSGVKEIKKNISKLKAFSKIGKEVAFDYDLSFLNLAKLDRRESSLLQSENSLNMDKNKITNSLFWFTDLSSVDSVALANLIKGDTDKSIEIFEKATKSNEVSSKNYSSFNNLSTLLLLTSLDDSRTDIFKKDDTSIQRIKKALQLKTLFLSSTFYNTYCEQICKSVALDSAAAQDFFTISILDLLNKNFNTKEISSLFDGLDNHLKEKLSDTLTEAPLSNVKSHIESANELIKSDEKSGSKVGKKLIKDTKEDFTHLKDVLGADDFQFQTLSDQLSNQIMQCGIVCFNSTGDDQDYLSSYKYALSIATGDKTKRRAIDCIKHCEEAKESANQNRLIQLIENFDKKYKKWENDKAKAIEAYKYLEGSRLNSGVRIMGPPGMGRNVRSGPVLPSVSLLLNYANNLEKRSQKVYAKLVQQYNQDHELVSTYGTAIINRIVNVIVMVMNEQIEIANSRNHTGLPFLLTRDGGMSTFNAPKLEKVKKSLGSLSQLINRLSEIKGSSEANTYLINTRKSLYKNLNTIKENLRPSSSNTYQRSARSNPKSEGCYIATMAYGNYDHPQVLELRKFRDEILENSLIGRLFISIYYSFSPRLVMHLQYKHKINIMIKKILDNFINYYLK